MRLNEFTVPVNFIGNGQPMATIIGGQHGDESLGVATVNQFLRLLGNYNVIGRIAVIPDCNPLAYGSREYNDIDLNRQHGQLVTDPYLQKIVDTINQLITDSVFVVDCHSSHELDEPCIVINKQATDLAKCFNLRVVNKDSPIGSLRNYAEYKGTPVITIEAIEDEVGSGQSGAEGIIEVLKMLGIIA